MVTVIVVVVVVGGGCGRLRLVAVVELVETSLSKPTCRNHVMGKSLISQQIRSLISQRSGSIISQQSASLIAKRVSYLAAKRVFRLDKAFPPLGFFFVGIGVIAVGIFVAVAGVFGSDAVEHEGHIFNVVLFLEPRRKIDHFAFGKV